MSLISDVLLSQQLNVMMQNLRKAEADLRDHVESDYEKVKVELTEVRDHFLAEVNSLRSRFSAEVNAYIDRGASPVQAVNQVENDKAAAAAAAPPPDTVKQQ